MNQGSYILSQLLGYVPKDVFDRIVKKYNGNKYVKTFTCWNQFCVMVYAQLAERESLRDLESVLMHHQSYQVIHPIYRISITWAWVALLPRGHWLMLT